MRAPLTYRITGSDHGRQTCYYLVCRDSTSAYWVSKELWPDLEIKSVGLLDEWSEPELLAKQTVSV